MSIFRRLMQCRQGSTAIEYGLIAVLLAVSVIVSVEALGNNISNLFTGTSNVLNNHVQ